MSTLARRWRTGSLVIAVALLAATLAWLLLPSPSIAAGVVALLLAALIVAPLRGLWRGDRYTYRWTTLCVVPYMIVALTEMIATPASRTWSAIVLSLAFGWFVALIGFLRVSAASR